MRLLVSVADEIEAREALAGGADIIDAKDPTRGALGAVADDTLRAIVAEVGGARQVSAALGDAEREGEIARAARSAAAQRVAYVKVGFAGVAAPARVERLLAAAVRATEMVSASAGVIAVAYADAERAGSVPPLCIIDAAERAGAVGVLLDTAFKDRGGLFDIMDESAVRYWVRMAHQGALTAAVAGRLARSELSNARALGADLVGVRGAACEGGRTGRVSRERVRELAAVVGAGRERPPQQWTPAADGSVSAPRAAHP